MQFNPDLRDEVAAGAVTLSIRLWRRPQVRVGGRYPVAGAVIEVIAMELVPFGAITAADLRRCGEPDRESARVRAAHAGPIRDDTLVHRIEFRLVPPTARERRRSDGVRRPVPAVGGTVVVIFVAETTVATVAATPPNVTVAPVAKPVPVIPTEVPSRPDVGVNDVIVGAAA